MFVPPADLNHLKSAYAYANQAALRAALRYQHRDWAELLDVQPTYRYSGKRKTRVTDFLLEPSPELDPTLPQINLIPLTEEQEIAKRRAVRALITEQTSGEVQIEIAPLGQQRETVVALPTTRATSRPGKRAR